MASLRETAATRSVTVESEGITVYDIVWRMHRRPMPGLVEQVLDLNYGLAGRGAVLPVGTVVTVPIVKPRDYAELADIVTLF